MCMKANNSSLSLPSAATALVYIDCTVHPSTEQTASEREAGGCDGLSRCSFNAQVSSYCHISPLLWSTYARLISSLQSAIVWSLLVRFTQSQLHLHIRYLGLYWIFKFDNQLLDNSILISLTETDDDSFRVNLELQQLVTMTMLLQLPFSAFILPATVTEPI